MSQESGEIHLQSVSETVETHGKAITEISGKLDEIPASVAKLSGGKSGE